MLDDQPVSAREARREAEKLLKRMVLLYPYQELNPLPQQGYLELASVVKMLDNPTGERELLTGVG